MRARGRYEIRGVMGPDEFHDAYPDAATAGVNNNAYTNVMAVWVLCRAKDVLGLLPTMRRDELTRRLGIAPEEIARWDDVSRRMYVPFHEDGVISQFEGYEKPCVNSTGTTTELAMAIYSASISSSSQRTTVPIGTSFRSRLTC